MTGGDFNKKLDILVEFKICGFVVNDIRDVLRVLLKAEGEELAVPPTVAEGCVGYMEPNIRIVCPAGTILIVNIAKIKNICKAGKIIYI